MTIQIHIDTLCQLLHRGMYFMYINSPLLVLRRGKKATIGAWKIVHGPSRSTPPSLFGNVPLHCRGHVLYLAQFVPVAEWSVRSRDYRGLVGRALCWLVVSGDLGYGSVDALFLLCSARADIYQSLAHCGYYTYSWGIYNNALHWHLRRASNQRHNFSCQKRRIVSYWRLLWATRLWILWYVQIDGRLGRTQ